MPNELVTLPCNHSGLNTETNLPSEAVDTGSGECLGVQIDQTPELLMF